MKKILFNLLLLMTACVLSVNAQSYKVIVNSSNSATSISKKEASAYFLKKKSKWPTGDKIIAVDLNSKAAARAAFSKAVLGKSTNQVRAFWQQSVFSGGATPPREFDSDQEVIDFVKNNKGAIGYVSSGTDVSGVKVITVQ